MTRCIALWLLLAACETPPAKDAPPSTDPPAPPAAPDPRPQAGDYDPCAGKACGDPCNLCAPGDADCVETMVVKACDAQRKCSDQAPACQ